MRPFLASAGIAIALALMASACGGGGATRTTPVATATLIPTGKATPVATTATPVGARAPGQVRTLPNDLLDQQACYQLGGGDAAQDRSAGATMDHAGANATDTGFLISGFGAKGQGLQELPTTIAWVESGVIKVEVNVLGGPPPGFHAGKHTLTATWGFRSNRTDEAWAPRACAR